MFGGAGSQVSIDDLGPGDYSHKAWMTPNADQGDGELSRDGKRLATTFFYGKDTLIAFFAVDGDARTQTPPAQPQLACQTGEGDEHHADPSWSPDSTSVAYQSSKGIEIARFNSLVPGSCDVAGDSILTATGTEPDWGPADAPAARYAPLTGSTPPPPATDPAKPAPPAGTPHGPGRDDQGLDHQGHPRRPAPRPRDQGHRPRRQGHAQAPRPPQVPRHRQGHRPQGRLAHRPPDEGQGPRQGRRQAHARRHHGGTTVQHTIKVR